MKATTGLAWCTDAPSIVVEVSVADCARLVEVGVDEVSIDKDGGGREEKGS